MAPLSQEHEYPPAEDLASIHARFSRRLLGLLAYLMGSREAGEDALGDVFVKLERALKTYDRSAPFEKWLFAVATRHCIDLLRRRRTEGTIFTVTETDQLAANEPSALSGLIESEQRDRIRGAILRLPVRYRVPLVLRYYEGASYQEIGERLGLDRNHVGTLLFRAKRELRRILAGENLR